VTLERDSWSIPTEHAIDLARSSTRPRDLAPPIARLRSRRSQCSIDGRIVLDASWGSIATVDRVRRSRLRPGELPSSYRWYDRRSGTVDLVALALESMTGVRVRPVLAEAPPWILALGLPTHMHDASLPELAHLSGRACRAWVDAGRPGLREAIASAPTPAR
jgi:hypothetical protein